jgi:hypothetical protein
MLKVTCEDIVRVLKEAVETLDIVQAAWLGGAASFGRIDEWSDIDFQCLASKEDALEVFAVVERTLEMLSPIQMKWAVPMPTWHGNPQRYYLLRDTSEYAVIDFVVLDPSSFQKYIQPERHGYPAILFDKKNLVKPVPINIEEFRQQVKDRLEYLRGGFPFFHCMTKRAIQRKNQPEALMFMHTYTLACLVQLLRIRYCPFRYDYGIRYTSWDLPAGVYSKLCNLYSVKGLKEISEKSQEAEQWFYATLDTIDVDTLDLLSNSSKSLT